MQVTQTSPTSWVCQGAKGKYSVCHLGTHRHGRNYSVYSGWELVGYSETFEHALERVNKAEAK